MLFRSLAEQHLAIFRERFATFPVRIACLNCFCTRAEQKQIIGDLATGKIDIVIGTHRLLSKDISFQKLGLLVVDEEHRFGVAHKEKIKKIKANVDSSMNMNTLPTAKRKPTVLRGYIIKNRLWSLHY